MIKRVLARFSQSEVLIIAFLVMVWVIDRPVLFPLFFLIPICWLGAFYRTGNFFPSTKLDIPILFLSVLTLLSVFITPDLDLSYPKILGFFLGISIYYGLCRIDVFYQVKHNTRSLLAWVLLCYLCLGGGIALLGLVSADWFDKYSILAALSERLPRLSLPLPGLGEGFQPNAISGTLTLFSPLAFYSIYGIYNDWGKAWIDELKPIKPAVIKVLLMIIGLVMGLWWLLSQARGAWLGMIAGLLVLVLAQWLPKRVSFLTYIIPASVVLVVYVVWFNLENVDLGVFSAANMQGANLSNTLQFRIIVWKWAAAGLADFSFTGMGYNIFREIAYVLYGGPYLGDVAHAHNMFLDVGVSLGLGGLLAYLALWIVSGQSLMSVIRGSKTRWQAYYARGLGAGWIAFFVFGLADTIPLGSKLGLAIFFSLALGVLLPFRINEIGRLYNGGDCE